MSAPPPGDRLALIVDDDPSMLRFLEVVLRRAVFDVDLAGTGAEALALLHTAGRRRPDVVLLDAMLPDMRGYDLARRLVADPSTAGLPICFLTGAVHGRVRTGAGVACVVKPTSPREIVATLEALLSTADASDPDTRRRAIDGVESLSLL